jgi:transcriptional regulator with XRE-family HTH domain
MGIEKKLKNARENANLTQEQVAQSIMVSRQTVSNWENGKSLPDIVSIVKLSSVYKMSIDELLGDDERLQQKIEKDANIAKTNRTVILATATVSLIAIAVYIISIFVGGEFLYFCENAIKWVLVVIGMVFAITYLINNNKLEFLKGVLKMKKMQIMAIILLLLGIWLILAPIGIDSKLPELASIASVTLGMICGIISLFVKDK